jgi:hypothetical protein
MQLRGQLGKFTKTAAEQKGIARAWRGLETEDGIFSLKIRGVGV